MSSVPLCRFAALLGLVSLLLSPLRALDFRVISWHGQLDGLFLVEGARRIPLQGAEQDLSPRQRITARKELVLYREARIEGRLVPVPVATLPVPADHTRALLVVAQDPANPNRVAGFWLDDSPNTFPAGSFVFHNLSKLPVALKAEDSVHRLGARESWSRGFPTDARFASVSAAATEGDAARIILDHRLKVHPDYRVIFIFRDGRASMANSKEIDAPVEYVMIYDHEIPAAGDSGEQRITGP